MSAMQPADAFVWCPQRHLFRVLQLGSLRQAIVCTGITQEEPDRTVARVLFFDSGQRAEPDKIGNRFETTWP